MTQHPPAPERSVEYDLDALRKNIDRCKTNIVTFETAIDTEHAQIKELRMMIGAIEEKQARDRTQ